MLEADTRKSGGARSEGKVRLRNKQHWLCWRESSQGTSHPTRNFTLTLLFRVRDHVVAVRGYLRVGRQPAGEIARFLLQDTGLQGEFPERETVTQ